MIQEISGKDSDCDQNSDDNYYDENVDENSEWLGIENRKQEQLNMDLKKKFADARMRHMPRTQIPSDTKSDADNYDIDVAPDLGTDTGSVRGLDEEDRLRPLIFDSKDENNPKIKLGQRCSSFKELKEVIRI